MQQTPCWHAPDWHSPPLAQSMPFGRCAARTADAHVRAVAVGVARARRPALAVRAAQVGLARLLGAGHAGAGAVAAARQRGHRNGAGGSDARRPRRVRPAAALAVAEAVGIAGRRRRVRALAERVLTVGDGGAGAGAAGQRARPAGAGAGRAATDPLLAEPRVALCCVAAGRPGRLLAAAPVDAAVGRHAIAVVRADDHALAVAAAHERRAHLGERSHAGAIAVAARGRFQHRSRARLRIAYDARGVFVAGARAVTDAVAATALHAHVVALVARVGSEIRGHAGTDRALQGACEAGVRAGAVAADAVGAKSALALRPEQAGRPERMAGRAAAVAAGRIARAAVGGTIVRAVAPADRRVVRRVLVRRLAAFRRTRQSATRAHRQPAFEGSASPSPIVCPARLRRPVSRYGNDARR